MKLKLSFIIFGVIFFNKIKSQLMPIFLLLVVIHYLLCNFFIDTRVNFIWKQILFLLLIFFNSQPLLGHAQLIHQIIDIKQDTDDYSWCSLHLIQGKNNCFLNHFQLSCVFSL